MLRERLPCDNLPVRLLGMGVSGLDDFSLVQGLLFDREEREKQRRVDAVSDKINEQLGPGALRRGAAHFGGQR